jgi:FKBP-type peptidyl-prolyl cis-trans isomerase
MQKTLLLPTLLLLAAPFIAGAQETAPAAPEATPAASGPKASDIFKSPAERQSYALGLNLAARLKQAVDDPKTINLDEVVKGMRSVTEMTASEDFVRGMNFALFLKQNDTKIDEPALLMAVKDTLAGEASKLTDSETRSELMSVQAAMEKRVNDKKEAFAAKQLEQANAFLEKNAKAEGVITTPSGLQYKVLKEAPQGGKLKDGDIPEVILATYDIEGARLDKGLDGKTRKISQTMNKGIGEAMKLMTIGSKMKFWIPPSLGWGAEARPGVKPNTLLIYEVELMAALEPPTKSTPAPLTPGGAIPGAPTGAAKTPISATTPPVAVEIPAGGGQPKVTPVDPKDMPKEK